MTLLSAIRWIRDDLGAPDAPNLRVTLESIAIKLCWTRWLEAFLTSKGKAVFLLSPTNKSSSSSWFFSKIVSMSEVAVNVISCSKPNKRKQSGLTLHHITIHIKETVNWYMRKFSLDVFFFLSWNRFFSLHLLRPRVFFFSLVLFVCGWREWENFMW